MSIISQASYSIFPLLILLIIYLDNRKHRIISTGDRTFDTLTIVVFISIFTYVASKIPSELAFSGSESLSRAFNCLHVTSVAGVGVIQVKYTLTRINPTQKNISGINALTLHIPFVAVIALAIILCHGEALFNLADADKYAERAVFRYPYICNALYLLVCMLLCGHGLSSRSADIVGDSKLLLGASIFAMTGIVLQLLLRDLWLALPITTLAVFFVYVSVQNKRITIDSLTGLNNRRELARLLEHRTRHREPFTVMLLDLDGFKNINDTYGHSAGDEALKRFAGILRESFSRAGYFFSRCGGDEFAFILPTHTDEAAQAFITELDAAVHASNAKSNSQFDLAFSAGYAIKSADSSNDWRDMYALADKRMYAEKNNGKHEGRMNVKGGFES